MKFNDYLLDYFNEDEERTMSESTREMLEDCFYRQQKKIDQAERHLGKAEKLLNMLPQTYNLPIPARLRIVEYFREKNE